MHSLGVCCTITIHLEAVFFTTSANTTSTTTTNEKKVLQYFTFLVYVQFDSIPILFFRHHQHRQHIAMHSENFAAPFAMNAMRIANVAIASRRNFKLIFSAFLCFFIYVIWLILYFYQKAFCSYEKKKLTLRDAKAIGVRALVRERERNAVNWIVDVGVNIALFFRFILLVCCVFFLHLLLVSLFFIAHFTADV